MLSLYAIDGILLGREGSFSSPNIRRDGEKDDERGRRTCTIWKLHSRPHNENLNNGLLLDMRGGRTLRLGSTPASSTQSGEDAIWHGVSRSAVGTFDSNGVFRIPSDGGEIEISEKDGKENELLERSNDEEVSMCSGLTTKLNINC